MLFPVFKSSAKDILKLREPADTTDLLTIIFANQAVPINKIVIANNKKDRKINKVCNSPLPLPMKC